jgi:hypothetical protein
MPEYRPNAAISPPQRVIISRCLLHNLDDYRGPLGDLPPNEREQIKQLAIRIAEPGPPLVSVADIGELLHLMRTLLRMRVGDTNDHLWGFVARTAWGYYLLAEPGGEKRLQSDDAVTFAQLMYEDHLRSRGLVP